MNAKFMFAMASFGTAVNIWVGLFFHEMDNLPVLAAIHCIATGLMFRCDEDKASKDSQ